MQNGDVGSKTTCYLSSCNRGKFPHGEGQLFLYKVNLPGHPVKTGQARPGNRGPPFSRADFFNSTQKILLFRHEHAIIANQCVSTL